MAPFYLSKTTQLAIILLCGMVVSCGQSPKDAEKPVDQSQSPMRIVSLFNTATEIVHALGHTEALVGVDVTSKFPPQANELPKMGHYPNFSAEGIIALQPDWVLARKDEIKPALADQLAAVGISLKQFDQTFSPDGTTKLIHEIATLLNTHEPKALITDMQVKLDQIQPLPEKPKILFIYARGNGPMLVAGNATQLAKFIRLAGAENAVSDFDNYQPISPEALVEANPSAVAVYQSALEGLQNGDALWNMPGMKNTIAGKNKTLFVLDDVRASSFGPRLGEAALAFNEKLRAQFGK